MGKKLELTATFVDNKLIHLKDSTIAVLRLVKMVQIALTCARIMSLRFCITVNSQLAKFHNLQSNKNLIKMVVECYSIEDLNKIRF